MPNEVEPPLMQSIMSQLRDILSDLQRLVEQQIQLTRREIEDELRQRASAVVIIALGIGALFVDAIMLCQTLAHLIHWGMSPSGSDPAGMPLWACYAVMFVGFAMLGSMLVLAGRARFRSVIPCHNPLTEIMQEHRP